LVYHFNFQGLFLCIKSEISIANRVVDRRDTNKENKLKSVMRKIDLSSHKVVKKKISGSKTKLHSISRKITKKRDKSS